MPKKKKEIKNKDFLYLVGIPSLMFGRVDAKSMSVCNPNSQCYVWIMWSLKIKMSACALIMHELLWLIKIGPND